jgi:hypothetical protein
MVGKRFFSIVAAAAAFACASGGAGGTSGGARRDSNVITADEIAASHETNAFDAISRLRPLFLRSHGRSTLSAGTNASDYATVFLDGQSYGDLSTLKNLVTPQIRQIRFYNGPDAVTKFGMQYGSGVIAIDTR